MTRVLFRVFALLLVSLAAPAVSAASAAPLPFPTPLEWLAPPDYPAAPGEAFAPEFAPPPAADPTLAPAIGEWSRSVRPDETFVLSGARLTARVGAEAGADTLVWLAGRDTNGEIVTRRCALGPVTATHLLATAPADLPPGLWLVWVETEAGLSAPVPLNRSTPRWLGPLGATAPPGSAKRVFGRDLTAGAADPGTAHVYLRPAAGGAFTPLTVTAANPHEVAFTIPADTAPGDYEVLLHNGQGGALGWGDPLPLTIAPAWTRDAFEIVLAPAEAGADDTFRIATALDTVAARPDGGTVRLAAGDYRITGQLTLLGGVRLVGDGAEQTTLTCDFDNLSVPDDHPLRYVNGIELLGHRVELAAFRLHQRATTRFHYGPIRSNAWPWIVPGGGPLRDLRLIDLTVTGEDGAPEGWIDLDWTTRTEVRGCDFSRMLNLPGGADNWVHANRLRGGPYLGNEQGAESALSSNSSRFVMEANLVENDWADFEIIGRPWARRLLNSNVLFSSVDNVFVARNIARGVAVRENKGEIVLLHGVGNEFFAEVASQTGTTTTIRSDGLVAGARPGLETYLGGTAPTPPASSVPDTLVYNHPYDGDAYLVIVSGPGQGQARRIASHSPTTLTVASPWRVPPEPGSVVVISRLFTGHTIYRNQLDAFPPGVPVAYSASTPVSMDGNAWDNLCIGNTSAGTYGGGTIGAAGTNPSYWNVFRDETVARAQTGGARFIAWAFGPTDSVGPWLLGNRIVGGSVALEPQPAQNFSPVFASASLSGGAALSGPLAAANIIEHVDYQATAPLPAVSVAGGMSIFARANTWAGGTFTQAGADLHLLDNLGTSAHATTDGSSLRPRLLPRERVALLSPSAPTALLPLANTGQASLAWTIVSSPPWLLAETVAPSALAPETTGEVLRLTVLPALVPDGESRALVRLRSSATGEEQALTARYLVPGAPVPAPSPRISPAGGRFTAPVPVNVAPAAPLPGSTIHHTLDGSEPDADSPTLDAPLLLTASDPTVEETRVVKARIHAPGRDLGPVASALFVFPPTQAAPVVFSPPPGDHADPVLVTFASPTPGALIRYTLDGTGPTPASPVHDPADPVLVLVAARLRAIAFHPELAPSAESVASYQVTRFGGDATHALFAGETPPARADDPASYELGLRFTPETDGKVTHLRVYRPPGAQTTHTLRLWRVTGPTSGEVLATATTAPTDAAGWQEVALSPPVPILANQTHLVSYGVPAGAGYAFSPGALAAPRRVGRLRAEAGGGAYAEAEGAFPILTYQNSHYWVDLRFAPAGDWFAPWAAHALPDALPADLAAEADPDGDGFGNLLEYALARDPAAPEPGLETWLDDAPARLSLSFLRARADLRYEVVSSSDLAEWTVVATDPGALGEEVTVTQPLPEPPPPGRLFLRLRVSQP